MNPLADSPWIVPETVREPTQFGPGSDGNQCSCRPRASARLFQPEDVEPMVHARGVARPDYLHYGLDPMKGRRPMPFAWGLQTAMVGHPRRDWH